MSYVAIEPLDTLLFRDTRPFQADMEGLGLAKSMFPPLPTVTAGAIRAAIARANGWSGRGDWKRAKAGDDERIVLSSLGDGPWDVGQWRFGPTLLCSFEGRKTSVLYPCPAHVFAPKEGRSGSPPEKIAYRLGCPGKSMGISTDMGVDLGRCVAPSEPLEAETQPGAYLAADDYLEVLAGKPPKRVFGEEDLFRMQRRTGIALDMERRTARHSMLYVSSHVRPMDDCDRQVGLCVAIEHEAASEYEGTLLTAALNRLADGFVLPLGGGGRAAHARIKEGNPFPENAKGRIKIVDRQLILTFLSPLIVAVGDLEPGKPVFDMADSELVSVATDKPSLLAPWNFSRFQRSEGFVALPAGTVLFLKASDPKSFQVGNRGWPLAFGKGKEIGFGACCVGSWPQGGGEKGK